MSSSHRAASWRWALSALVLLILIGSVAFFQTLAARATFGSKRAFIHGNLILALRHLTPLHALADNQPLQLTLALQPRNQKALDTLLAEQNDLHSSQYHRYLTPQQFTSMFSPSTATVNKIVGYLRAEGLAVGSIAANRLLINVSGKVSDVEKTFAITIANYKLHQRIVYAPTSEPSVPVNLDGLILSISGLDDVAHYQPLVRLGSATGPTSGYEPKDLRTAYDINSLISSSNGSGQTVALFELDGYNPDDVNAYLTQYNLGAPRYSDVLVDDANNTAGAGAVEVELDMEILSAIAPGAAQKIYIGVNSTSGMLNVYNKIVTDNLAKVVSTSWGLCETNSGNAQLAALDDIFKQGAAQGMAFFSASGDAGAYDCGTDSLGVDSPSDDPYVVGVGGTALKLGSNSSYGSEAAWSDPKASGGIKGSGGGGGYSSFFPKPAYQTGPGFDTNTMRHTPDISGDADPATGYTVYCTAIIAGCPLAGWISVGGTSAAAPLWAGIATDINGYLLSQGKNTLGSASTTLYQLFNTSPSLSAYHDVTEGDNLFYKAGPGYDLATGIGTPDAWNFARDAAALTGGPGKPSSTPAPNSPTAINQRIT